MDSEKMSIDKSSELDLLHILANISDSDLLEITNSYRNRLEDSVVEYVIPLSTAFQREAMINSDEFKEVNNLVAKKENKIACKKLFNKFIDNGYDDIRKLWMILEKNQKINLKLNAVIKEIVKTGTTEEKATDNAESRCDKDEHDARNISRTDALGITGEYLATGVQEERPGKLQRKMTVGEYGKHILMNDKEAEKLSQDIDNPEIKEQHSSRKQSYRNNIHNTVNGEVTAHKAKRRPAEDEQENGNEGEREAKEITNQDPATCGQKAKPGTSEDGRKIGEKEEEAEGKTKTRPAENKHGADNEREVEAIEIMIQDPAIGGRAEKAGALEDGGKTAEIKEHRDTGNESDRNKLQLTVMEEDVVDDSKNGRPKAEHHTDKEGEEYLRINAATTTQAANHATEMNLGQNNLKPTYNLNWHPAEIGKSNVDQQDKPADKICPFKLGHSKRRIECEFHSAKAKFENPEPDQHVNVQHRTNLRNQTMNLNLPKPRLISDIYTEPTITVIQGEHANITGETNTTIRKVEYHELFKRSNRDFDQSTISVIYGAAGTGKTTLIQKLIYDWSMGKIYEEFSFVLHFNIQKLNEIKCPITFSRLIVDIYPYLENYLDNLWNEPKRLLLIFDDLDQFVRLSTLSDTGRISDPRYRCIDTESEHVICDILRCLLLGEFLRGCSVLITTRVLKLEFLHHVAADLTFQVKGFTFEKAKEYFRRYLHNGQNSNEIVDFIEQNDILWNMCSDPLFCITLAMSLESFQAQGKGQTSIPIVSHTQVLSDYVANLLRKCGYDDNTNRKCLIAIGELAEKGIRQNTFSFEDNALRDLGSCPPMLISTFIYDGLNKQSDGVIYKFRHSILRDFLAALTNVLNAPLSQLKRTLDERSTDITGRFSIFSIFLVGLCSRKSIDRLERELQTFPTEVTSCISEWLTQSVSRRLKDMDTKHTQRMFLCILYCLLEFGDNEIMKEVLNPITTIKLNHLRLKSPDCIVLSRTLISLEIIEELDLSSCFAEPVAIWKLDKVLPSCVILRLNQNKLQDSGVKRLFDVLKNSKVKTLALKSNHLTDNCLESVFSALTKNPSLMHLNLSNSSEDGKQTNQFTDEKLKYHYARSTQQKEIKWLRIKNIGQDFTRSSRESNCLTLITD